MPERICSIEGCADTHYAHSFCKYHYEQQPNQREAARRYDKARRSTPQYREYERDRYQRRKEKKAANNALYQAILRGEVEKQPCAVCGDRESQGHHEDYRKPLQVTWLCSAHHAELHAGRGVSVPGACD